MPRIAAALVALLAVIVLVGWATGSAVMRAVAPRAVPMAPNTAVGLLLAGAALWLTTEAPGRSVAATLARLLAAGAAAIGLLTALEYASGADLWIDRVLFQEELRELPFRPPGRIAPNTALNMVLTGLSLLWLGGRGKAAAWAAQSLALAVAFSALQALIGYAYGVEPLYGILHYTPIAVHTAASFLVLSIGILFARPDRGAMAVVTRPGPGGYMARRVLPAAIASMVVLGWLRLAGERLGLYDSPFGTSLLVMASVVLFALLIWLTAAALGRLDAKRRRAEAERERLLEREREARRELQQVLESRSRLMRGFSHDVKNPLGAADGQLALLAEDTLDGLRPRQREGVERARRSIGSAIRLIDALVDLARAETGRMAVERWPADLRGIAREIGEEYRATAEASDLQLSVEIAPTLPPIRSDPDRIRQILGNLVSNAVKYTPEGGRVTVRAEESTDGRAPGPGRWAAIDVADTGPGIPEDKREEVFREFTRIETGEGRGAGLGLAISRRIARLLGGDVTLESETGRGSTFTLWLPLEMPARDDEAGATRAPATSVAARHPDADGAAPSADRHGEEADAERERLLARERAARAEAETAREEAQSLADRFAFLLDATRALVVSLDYEDTLERLARLSVPRLGDLCFVDVTENATEIRRVAAIHRDPAMADVTREMLRFVPDPVTSPTARALAHAESRIIPETTDDVLRAFAHDEDHLRLMRAVRPQSAMLVPLVARGRTLGILTLISAESGRRYERDDLELAEALTNRAAVAVDNARLFQAANEASRAKSEFLAIMSHELRTPLNAIVGFADLLAGGFTGAITDAQRDQVRRIRASALHLRDLIDEILMFSKLETGREGIAIRRTDVARVVREAAALVASAARDKGLRLEVDVPDTPVEARTDPAKVRRILLNLLNNAVAFTDEGEVRLGLTARDETIEMRVSDTGIGISAEDRKHIFEPFWQAERGLTRVVGGTGVGLTVARRLARMLEGDVLADSEPGRGSTFTVTLPPAPRPPS